MAADCVSMRRHATLSKYKMTADCAFTREICDVTVVIPPSNAFSFCFRSPLDFAVGQRWKDDITDVDSSSGKSPLLWEILI